MRNDEKREVHADHAGVAEAKKKEENGILSANEARREVSRNRSRAANGGSLPGKWYSVGRVLICLEAVTFLELPAPTDQEPEVKVHLRGGETLTLFGEDAKDFVSDHDLSVQEFREFAVKKTLQTNETGDIIPSLEDFAARNDESRNQTVPVREEGHQTPARNDDPEEVKREGATPVRPQEPPHKPQSRRAKRKEDVVLTQKVEGSEATSAEGSESVSEPEIGVDVGEGESFSSDVPADEKPVEKPAEKPPMPPVLGRKPNAS